MKRQPQAKGFHVMDKELCREIARLGGKATKRKYGRKHYQEIGRKGGKARVKKQLCI